MRIQPLLMTRAMEVNSEVWEHSHTSSTVLCSLFEIVWDSARHFNYTGVLNWTDESWEDNFAFFRAVLGVIWHTKLKLMSWFPRRGEQEVRRRVGSEKCLWCHQWKFSCSVYTKVCCTLRKTCIIWRNTREHCDL